MNIYQILQELKENNSNNHKIETLQKHKDNELFKRVLSMTYDKVKYIYGISLLNLFYEPGKAELKLESVLDSLENDFCSRKVTGNAGIELMNTHFNSLSKEDAYVLERIIDRDLDIGINTKTINKVFPGLITTVPYMRGSKLDEKTSKNIDFNDAIIQKKSDGVFSYIIKRDDKVILLTRNGRIWDSVKIEKELAGLPNNIVISGEALIKEKDRELDRKTGNGMINSLTKKQSTLETLYKKYQDKPTQKNKDRLRDKEDEFKEIDLNVFFEAWDIVSLDEFEKGYSGTPYKERLQYLENLIKKVQSIDLIWSAEVQSLKEAQDIAKDFQNRGYEGCMLKSGILPWEDKTSKYMLKMKAIKDADLLCTGYEPGTGNNKGGIGALYLESKCKKLQVKVGTGLSMEDRGIRNYKSGDELVYEPIKDFNIDKYTGKIIEVQYNEVIKSKGKDTYSLFLPVFIEYREDKDNYNSLEELK